MIAARSDPQREQLGAGKAERPQGGQIGRVQVGLPGQRLPHDGERRQPDENTTAPTAPGTPAGSTAGSRRSGSAAPRECRDATQARGPHLPQERLAARGAVAEPDQQRRIAPAMAGCRSTGRTRASRRRCQTPTRRRRPGTARERPRSPRCGRRRASGGLASGLPTMNLIDAAHPQVLTVGGGEVDHRLAGCAQVHHPAGDHLEPVQPETRPPHQVGDGHQFRRRRHPAGRQDGRRCRHIDAGPLRDLGHRLHPRQRPPRIDVPRGTRR